MNIVVCVKQVPDTAEVKINPETNTIIRQGLPNIVNPYDKHALEAAIQLKEKHGGKITVISMGPPQATEALKECIAMGADEAVLLSDRIFGGADALATSFTIAAGIRKIADFDLIICGKQAIDGDTAQVGPEVAEHLNIPQVTYAAKLDVDGKTLKVSRELDVGYEIIETELPALVTVVKSINDPRLPTVRGTMKANRIEIPVWSAEDIEVNVEKIGFKGSPTQVRKIFAPPARTQGEMIQADDVQTAAAALAAKLKEAKIL